MRHISQWLQKWRGSLQGKPPDIDVVYTWVDGADPDFQNEFTKFQMLERRREDPLVAGECRFRNNDELRYSLRSLEAHAPWINRVFLVTNGQVPRWLDLNHPRLRLVSHGEIFPNPAHLPTYNSLAIEAHLHRIPGLSRYYLYMNDDWFFGRAVAREDFISRSGRPRILVDPWALPRDLDQPDLTSRWLAWNKHLLCESFGKRRYASIPHAPVLFDLVRVKEVAAHWHGEFEHTSAQRFRTDRVAMMQALYTHTMAARNLARIVPNSAKNCQFVAFRPPLDALKNELAGLLRSRPKFFAINDDWDGPDEEKAIPLREFLESYFPSKSSFENRAEEAQKGN